MLRSTHGSASLAVLLLFVSAAQADEPIGYNQLIRPILMDNCFACHGPDSASRKADLRLDRREAAIERGVIVPGKPEASSLVERIASDDPDMVMPPPASHKTLTPAQKDLLKRWIAAGAEYQPHWSFIAPVRPPLPEVKDKAWPRSPIDQFVLAKLEAAGLHPAPEADRRVLARRASLDITGLPPDPADVEAFVNDSAPEAYERYVDRLLAMPQWGEHRGRHWLDVARYADTHGIHFDNYRENWSYRDWVIAAFNRNMPFDQFTTEQLAGDLLPNRTLDQQVGSSFNRCNMTTNEGGVIPEEYLVLYTRDRTETVSQVWLGMTTGCAVCHDHKFDPFSQREFYELAAFFNNTTQGAMDGNIKDTPPIVMVPAAEDRQTWEALPAKLADAQQKIDARPAEARSDFDTWLATATRSLAEGKIPTAGLAFHAPLDEAAGTALAISIHGQPRPVNLAQAPTFDTGITASKAYKSRPEAIVEVADAGNFEKDQSFSASLWVKLPKDKLNGALRARMDDQHEYRGRGFWLDQGRLATHIINKWPENALKVVCKKPLSAGTWQRVTLTYTGTGDANAVRLYVDGVLQEVDVPTNALKDTIRTDVPLKLAQRHTQSRIDDVGLQDVRFYNRALTPEEVTQLSGGTRAAFVLSKPAAERTGPEIDELYRWWLNTFDPKYQELAAAQRELQVVEAGIKLRATISHVQQEKPEEAMAYILFRGEYDKRRDPVKAGTPAILPSFPADQPRNRLGLAQWLLRPEHPLTARVTVNRYWQEVFGTGLVKTSGDFGVAGEMPSHPELLDWLAVDFRETGWDLKRLFRQMVLSATYRQSAAVTPEKLEKDPHNRLLSRGPRFRMDGEMVRDYALAASGMLVRKLGGPSVKPYQPEGVWEAVAMIGSNTRDYRHDKGEKLYRRSLYTFWKRAAPPASMEIFNAPNREVCTVRRERTNTPLQALVTLNDPQFVEAARHLAERTLREGGEADAARIDFIARRLLARPLSDEERGVVEPSLVALMAHYRGHVDEAKELIAVGESKPDDKLDVPTLAGWTMLVNELLNLDEALNK